MAWRIAYTVGLALVVGLFWLIKGRVGHDAKAWKWAMFSVGLAAFFHIRLWRISCASAPASPIRSMTSWSSPR